ncbi:MAG: BMP family ABC transporter substrate-binding protein [Acidimicrobiia bacterium]|nr:BMP family ABC transporter substrate-binding protein [Acidimicrobiia bacterium]
MRRTRWTKPAALAMGLALVAGACGEADETATDTTDGSTDATTDDTDDTAQTEGGEGAVDYKACEVTDTGGIDDWSFNQTAFEGLVAAGEELGTDYSDNVLESTSEADFTPNIDAHIENNCDMVVTVGFLLGDATAEAAEANPDTDFAIVDFAYDETIPNVRGLVFATEEAAFLAGYVAAAVSESGTVGMYGGQELPSVTAFMDGFEQGVEQYNTDTGEAVEAVGRNLFTGDFENQTNGRTTTEQLLDQGADVIMPVAGPVGLGSIEAIDAAGGADVATLIWVDSDGFESTDAGELMLTSVQKNMDVAVQEAVLAGADGTFEGGVSRGTLENGGVDIAPFHDFEDAVPEEVTTRLEELREEIIDGTITIELTG